MLHASEAKSALAENWLTTWYTAETLARHASACNCKFVEGDDGAADFEFRFTVSDSKGMAAALADFAAVLDPRFVPHRLTQIQDVPLRALLAEARCRWLISNNVVRPGT